MTSDEYESHDAIGLAERVQSGEVHPSELLDAALARAADHNPTLNAIVIDMEKQARSAIEAGLPDGPLRGNRCCPRRRGPALGKTPAARQSSRQLL